MSCPVSTYSFAKRFAECGLYGFSATQVLLLVGALVDPALKIEIKCVA